MSEAKQLKTIPMAEIIIDFDNCAELTPVLLDARRERITQLEAAMFTLEDKFDMDEYNEANLTHHFGTGVYGRELFIPAGDILISKIHRGKTFNVIAQGCISVICPHNGFNTYSAPHTFVSEPFTKRVVIAHEDTIWVTSHGTTKTELCDIEEEIIAKSFLELNQLTGEDK